MNDRARSASQGAGTSHAARFHFPVQEADRVLTLLLGRAPLHRERRYLNEFEYAMQRWPLQERTLCGRVMHGLRLSAATFCHLSELARVVQR